MNTLPTLVSRPLWATNAAWSGGPLVGQPNKVQPPNAYLFEGVQPGGAGATQSQGIAEYENWWRNQTDLLQLYWREYVWNTVHGSVYDASYVTDIARAYDRQTIALHGASPAAANVITRALDGDGDPTYLGITYSAEGAGLIFSRALAPDIPPDGVHGDFVVAGTLGATPLTAHEFGCWQVDYVAGTVTPIGDSVLTGGVSVTDRLVRCIGGYAYAFTTGFGGFRRLSPGVMPPGAGGTTLPSFADPFSPSSIANAHIVGAALSSGDVLLCADWDGTHPTIKVAVSPFSSLLANSTRTAYTIKAVAVTYSATFGAFLVLYADGSIEAVDPASGAISAFASAPGLKENLSTANMCDQGWLGMGSKLVYCSSNFFTARTLQLTPHVSALGLALFDGACFWLPNSSATGQGSMQRTLHI